MLSQLTADRVWRAAPRAAPYTFHWRLITIRVVADPFKEELMIHRGIWEYVNDVNMTITRIL